MTMSSHSASGGFQLRSVLAYNLLLAVGIITFSVGLLRPIPQVPLSSQASSPGDAMISPPDARFDRVIFMVIDALRSDMVFSNASGFSFTQSLIRSGHALPFTSHADPPSLTVPRLKSMTTGANPSFLDLFLNLADSEDALTLVHEDSWLHRLKAKDPSRKLAFYGYFQFWDSMTGDRNITSRAMAELQRDDWSALVLHFPGVDHVGHLRGPYSRDMFLKQEQMDRVVKDIYTSVREQEHLNSTLFILAGDHGMNEKGNHGGCTPGETAAALLFASPSLPAVNHTRLQAPAQPRGGRYLYYDVVQQADLVPTLSGLLGLPIPRKNVGAFIPAFLGLWPEEERLEVLRGNEAQLKRLHELHSPEVAQKSPPSGPGNNTVTDETDTHRLLEICRQYQRALTRASGNLQHLLMAGGLFSTLLALGLAVRATKFHLDPVITFWLPAAGILGSYGYALVSGAVEEQEIWQYGALAIILFECPVRSRHGIPHFAAVVFLGFLSQLWNSAGPGSPAAVVEPQSAANWGLIAVTMVSAILSLQTGLRGVFPGSKSLSAVAVLLGLGAFVVKLAAAARDSPGSFAFIPAHVEARLFALDVDFAHNMLFTAIQFAAVLVLAKRCSGRHTGKFTDVLYALFGLLQLYLLTLSRVWNTPLFLIFGLQIDLLSPHLAEMPYEQIAITCAFLAQSSYFSFGNTQAIGSADLAPGFAGSTSYSLVPVVIKTIMANWAGPIWWSLASLVFLAEKVRIAEDEAKFSKAEGGQGRSSAPEKANFRVSSDYDALYGPFVCNLGVHTMIMCAASAVLMGCIAWMGDGKEVWDLHAPRFIFLCVYIIFVHLTCSAVAVASLGWCWLELKGTFSLSFPRVIMAEQTLANASGPPLGLVVPGQTPEPITSGSGAAPAGARNPSKRSKLQTTVVVASLCAAVFVAALDVTIITTALPAITEFFRSPNGYQWVGSGYVLPHTASVPSWGKLSDVWGRKPVILAGAVLFIAGSLLCALAETFPLFLFGRAVQGLGAAGLITLVNICISDLFSLRDRGLWCFWINLPIGSVVSILIFFLLRLDTVKTSVRDGLRSIDWIGTLFISGSVLMVLLGLDFGGNTHPWDSATVICLIVFGVICGALFVLHEAKWARFPIIPVEMFNTRSSAAAFALCFCHGFVFIGIAYYLPLYLQAVLATTALRSGLYLLPYILSVSISAAFTGAFIQWTGKYMPSVYVGGVMLCVGAGLLISLGPEPQWAKIIGYQIVAGTGVGFNFEGPLLAVQAVMGVEHVATVTATMGFVRTMSTAVSIVVGGVVFQNRMVNQFSNLAASLGPELARELAGSEILAKLDVITGLPGSQQRAVREAISNSLKDMWIMYVAFAGASLVAGLFIRAYHLNTELEVKSTPETIAEKNASRQQGQQKQHSEPPQYQQEQSGLSQPSGHQV
ncbi:hypothetical protein INS49_015678 [Diaporthe citri]|uniref:uncharacterized protein n=1 Tax=Diaporthe citri TaxID=83186 RepID=UPI001C81FB29|nr:uncharacterized protein INS49_015678 [Diaporthe citri]KAG6356291.1 hypothetical protein INS49_015678 [Diaporthe citri]